jgi:hypothetical protein
MTKRKDNDEFEPPCLQKLVAKYGTYADITPRAWAKYEGECNDYREALRARRQGERMGSR